MPTPCQPREPAPVLWRFERAHRRAHHVGDCRAGRRIGADVVVGSVISGGCRIIDQLLRGFECLPGTRGAARIDLDSVRRRAPSILLIDTCICDIEPIVALGVSVWAAVDATGLCSWTTVTEVGAAPFASLSRL